MKTIPHWAIFINNESHKKTFINSLITKGIYKELDVFKEKKIHLFSKITIEKLIAEEDRHQEKTIAREINRPLKAMSSGEQKRALLTHLLQGEAKIIILDNPFDNLDTDAQKDLKETLAQHANASIFIQLISRQEDTLSFIQQYARLTKDQLLIYNSLSESTQQHKTTFKGNIPKPLTKSTYTDSSLIAFKNVSVSYGDNKILNKINWHIEKGSFWQLIGKNGSGKTTLLSMLTGENPKGYGQDLYLFGKKKGSGESIWDIKKRIGYFTPSLTDTFKGRHSIENMIISGVTDSIGLYTRPTEVQKQLAKEWLILIDMWEIKDKLFVDLSMGQKRLIMTTRAMVKHPELLILDEPTSGLDDASAQLLVALVNKIAKESTTAILFVSHRAEPGLNANQQYVLTPTEMGSTGSVM